MHQQGVEVQNFTFDSWNQQWDCRSVGEFTSMSMSIMAINIAQELKDDAFGYMIRNAHLTIFRIVIQMLKHIDELS